MSEEYSLHKLCWIKLEVELSIFDLSRKSDQVQLRAMVLFKLSFFIIVLFKMLISYANGTLSISHRISDQFFDLSLEKNEFSIPVSTFRSSVGSWIDMSLKEKPSWAEYSISDPQSIGIMRMNGDANNVFVSGDYAYISEGVGIRIIDIKDKNKPLLVGNVDAEGSAKFVFVEGDYAFLADGYDGLKIYYVKDKTNPILLSKTLTAGSAVHVLVSDNYAYVAALGNMQIFNVDEKSSPQLVGQFPTSSSIRKLFLSGNRMYIAESGQGLKIVDVSSKTNPTIVGNWTEDPAYDVFVEGDYAYISGYYAGVSVLDISNPSTPLHVNNFTTGGAASGLFVSENVLFVTNVFVAGLGLYDVTTPTAPIKKSSFLSTKGSAYDVFVSSDTKYAYVADSTDGMLIVDISNRTNPTISSIVDTNGESSKVVVSQYSETSYYIYLADSHGGLKILDATLSSHTSSFEDIRLIGSLTTKGSTHDVVVKGDYAYLACGKSGLVILDVSTKTQPEIISTVESFEVLVSVFLLGNYAYVADDKSGLWTVDVSDPSHPVKVGSYPVEKISDIMVVGTTAYVVVGPSPIGNGGLFILDISDPSHPEFLGNVSISETSIVVAVYVQEDEKYAYLADMPNGLDILDISDKSKPKLLSSLDTGHTCYDVLIQGNYAFMADRLTESIVVADISDRVHPKKVASSKSVGLPEGLFAWGNYFFVAGARIGVEVFRFGDISVSLSQPSDILCGNTSLAVSGLELDTKQELQTDQKLYCSDSCPTVTKMKGSCVESTNLCKCNSQTEWYGKYCDEWYCYGVKHTESGVCSSHGTCVGLDNCKCMKDFHGDECGKGVENRSNVTGLVVGLSLTFGFCLIVLVVCLFGCCLVLVAAISIPIASVITARKSSVALVGDEVESVSRRTLGRPLIDEMLDENYGEMDVKIQ